MDVPPELLPFFFAAFGLCVGSFLNVCIHRLPLEDQTVAKPARSHCPSCGYELTWRDNLPVLSWVLLRGKCRSCAWRIPWRYPLVEILTAALWAAAAWRAPFGEADAVTAWGLAATYVLVLSGLVVATFIDFAHFEIPDEVSKGGMWIAPALSFLVPALHADTAIARSLADGDVRISALLASLSGMAVGGGAVWGIGWVGTKLFRKDAMGFGDVKLLAAGGGFIGPGGALAALLLGAMVASMVGVANMFRWFLFVRARARSRGTTKPIGKALRFARTVGQYIPFGPYLGIGIGIVLLDWNHVLELWNGLSN